MNNDIVNEIRNLNIKDTECCIFYFEDGYKIVANHNIIGGVCDDCRAFNMDDVIGYKIISIAKDGLCELKT